MIHGSASTSPNPDFVPLEYAVGCEDCERIKDFSHAPRTVPLVRSQYSGGGLVCQECEEERAHVEALVDIGELVSRLRELGWEDVAELVIRRKLSPADQLFRTLDQFVVDQLVAQHPRSREDSDSIAGKTRDPLAPQGPMLLRRVLEDVMELPLKTPIVPGEWLEALAVRVKLRRTE